MHIEHNTLCVCTQTWRKAPYYAFAQYNLKKGGRNASA